MVSIVIVINSHCCQLSLLSIIIVLSIRIGVVVVVVVTIVATIVVTWDCWSLVAGHSDYHKYQTLLLWLSGTWWWLITMRIIDNDSSK